MKYTVETLLDYPNYMHRVLGYALRNSRYRDAFGVAGAFGAHDRRLYLRVGYGPQVKVLCYANDFEIVRYMPAQGGCRAKIAAFWTDIDEKTEANLAECSAEYTKLMLLLNFDEREEFCRKYTQYKIGLFGMQNSSMSTNERKVAVAHIKKESKVLLSRLTQEIYFDAFSFLFDNYFTYQDKIAKHQEFLDFVATVTDKEGNFSASKIKDFRLAHPEYFRPRKDAVFSSADPIMSVVAAFRQSNLRGINDEEYVQKSITKSIANKLDEYKKDEAYLQKFVELVDKNQEVMKYWRNTAGKKYFSDRKKAESKTSAPAESSNSVLNQPDSDSQNIIYRLPQFSSIDDVLGSCKISPLAEVDFVPIIQNFIDNYSQEHTLCASSRQQSADRGAN